jgi:hypothetical protein
MRFGLIICGFALSSLLLAGCGKNDKAGSPATADACANVKASPPLQTYAQAVEECRSRHRMADQPDAKPSNTPISNH